MGNDVLVKVCPKCGILSSDDDKVCEACGARLGEAVSNDDADKLIDGLNKKKKKIEKAKKKMGAPIYENDSYLGYDDLDIPVTMIGKVCGVLSCITIVAILVLWVISIIISPKYAIIFLFVDIVIDAVLLLNIISCFKPAFGWKLSQFGYSLRYYGSLPEPSELSFALMQIGYIASFFIGVFVFVAQLLLLF